MKTDKDPYALYTLEDLEDVAEKSWNSALRAVRDAIQEIHDIHHEVLERDERYVLNDHVLALFNDGGRFEVKGDGE